MCVSPIQLTREICGRKYTQWVPCGKCPECIKDKQNEYVIRTVEESHKKGNPWFITLTYSEDTVSFLYEEDESGMYNKVTGELVTDDEENHRVLNNKDITNWKKRVRRHIEYHTGKKLDFSYLICGEYGPRTHRPHYHGILLGLTDEEVMEFKKDWEKHYGFTSFEKVNITEIDRVGSYISKYICKQPLLEEPLVTDGVIAKPRKITARGFGMPNKKRFDAMKRDVLGELSDIDPDTLSGKSVKTVSEQLNRIINNNKKKYKLNGREYKLPGYYWKKFTYIKDAFTRKDRGTLLSKMVSRALQNRVQKNFTDELIRVAANYNMAEDDQARIKASKIVCDSEKVQRQERAEIIIKTNIQSLRKSKF